MNRDNTFKDGPDRTVYRLRRDRPDVGLAYRALVPAIQDGEAEYLAIAQKGYPGACLEPGEADGLLSVGNMATHDKRALHMEEFCLQGIMFLLTFQGILAVKVNHKKHLVHPGELLLLPPGTHFAIGDPVASCARIGWLLLDVKASDLNTPWRWPDWLMLDEEERREFTRELVKRGVRIQKVSDDFIHVYTRLTMLSSQADVSHRGSRLKQMISLSMLELLDFFLSGDGGIKKDSPSLRSVQKFLHELPDQLSTAWTIEAMAEACGLGVSKFSEQVNILTAESPAKHLARLRLENACELLRKSTLPLSAIAQETGFSCVSYFSRAFVRRYHKNPTQFRNEV
ncbi:MAG: AraC family transcriptional regulator [bacterium]